MFIVPIKSWHFLQSDHCWLEEFSKGNYVNVENCNNCGHRVTAFANISCLNGEQGMSVAECSVCGHIQKSRKPSREANSTHFRDKWLKNRQDRKFSPNDNTFRLLDKYFKEPGTVLEIGCGSGTNLAPFQVAGWKTFGFDPSVSEIEIAKEQGIQNVKVDTAESYWSEIQQKFDLIFMRDVLQFIDKPYDTVSRYLPFLKQNGIFMTTNGNFRNNNIIMSCHHGTIPNHPTLTALKHWCSQNKLQVKEESEHPAMIIAQKTDLETELFQPTGLTNWHAEIKKATFASFPMNLISGRRRINKFRSVNVENVRDVPGSFQIEFQYDLQHPPVVMK